MHYVKKRKYKYIDREIILIFITYFHTTHVNVFLRKDEVLSGRASISLSAVGKVGKKLLLNAFFLDV